MVSENASMALDDYIAKSKIGKGGRGGGGGGGGRGRSRDGGGRGGGNRGNRERDGDRGRIQKRQPRGGDHDDRGFGGGGGGRRGRNMDDTWEHDMYKGGGRSAGGRGGGGGGGTKLLVDNLDFGVTDEDMQELFQEFGNLRKAVILYDRSGRSTGQAEIEFSSVSGAERAREQYNGVPLDGRAMKISMVVSDPGRGGARDRLGGRGGGGGGRSRSRSPRRGRGGGGGRGRGGGGQGRGGGGGGGKREPREKKEDVTQEQLDREMDEYLSQKK